MCDVNDMYDQIYDEDKTIFTYAGTVFPQEVASTFVSPEVGVDNSCKYEENVNPKNWGSIIDGLGDYVAIMYNVYG